MAGVRLLDGIQPQTYRERCINLKGSNRADPFLMAIARLRSATVETRGGAATGLPTAPRSPTSASSTAFPACAPSTSSAPKDGASRSADHAPFGVLFGADLPTLRCRSMRRDGSVRAMNVPLGAFRSGYIRGKSRLIRHRAISSVG